MDEELFLPYRNVIYPNLYTTSTVSSIPAYTENSTAATSTSSTCVADIMDTQDMIQAINRVEGLYSTRGIDWWQTPLTYRVRDWHGYGDYNSEYPGTIRYAIDHTDTGGYNWSEYYRYPSCSYVINVDPTDLKRQEIKSHLTIHVKSRAQELSNIPKNEWVAMQTLRDMITETEYRKYIKDGFISVLGESGKVYQVFRNRAHTKVYLKGELIEEICVRLNGDTPPTDSVIAFKTMIEFNEEYFASLGNRYNMRQAA